MRLREADVLLVEVLRRLPELPAVAQDDVAALLARAELHGVAGLVHDALGRARATGCAELEREFAWREAARELDHAAHLKILRRIDVALAARGLVAVALKGPLLAERFYARPSARATSDIDLLVDEAKLEVTAAALEEVGYVGAAGSEEQRYRREHHHLHLSHPNALPLELHFHAYRGLGRTLHSEPFIARSRRYIESNLEAIRVLSPEDELVFLSVHGAAHRFVRLGWLFDLRLLAETLSFDQRMLAFRRATQWGYARPLSFAIGLLIEVLGMNPSDLEPLVGNEPWRLRLVGALAAEPDGPLRRSASRFLYSLALCDSPRAALRYSRTAVAAFAARVAGEPS